MTNNELIANIRIKIDVATQEWNEVKTAKSLEPIESTRWNVFYQMEKDLYTHILNLGWTLSYFEEYKRVSTY